MVLLASEASFECQENKQTNKQTWAFACSSALLSRVFAEAPRAGMQLSRDYSLRLWGSLQLCPRACRISLCRLCDSGLSDSQLTHSLPLFVFIFKQSDFSPPFSNTVPLTRQKTDCVFSFLITALTREMHSTGVVWG